MARRRKSDGFRFRRSCCCIKDRAASRAETPAAAYVASRSPVSENTEDTALRCVFQGFPCRRRLLTCCPFRCASPGLKLHNRLEVEFHSAFMSLKPCGFCRYSSRITSSFGKFWSILVPNVSFRSRNRLAWNTIAMANKALPIKVMSATFASASSHRHSLGPGYGGN